MRHAIIAAAGLAAFAVGAASAQPEERAAFETMCARVSAADGVPGEAIAPFCSCLAERAVQSSAVYRELWDAAETQPDPDARLAALTPAARDAVQACRAPAPAAQ